MVHLAANPAAGNGLIFDVDPQGVLVGRAFDGAAAKKRDELAPFQWPISPVLPPEG